MRRNVADHATDGMRGEKSAASKGCCHEQASVSVISNCLFQENTSTFGSGAVANLSDTGGSPLFVNCRFILNVTVGVRDHLALLASWRSDQRLRGETFSSPVPFDCRLFGGDSSNSSPRNVEAR